MAFEVLKIKINTCLHFLVLLKYIYKEIFATNYEFINRISLQPDVVDFNISNFDFCDIKQSKTKYQMFVLFEPSGCEDLQK